MTDPLSKLAKLSGCKSAGRDPVVESMSNLTDSLMRLDKHLRGDQMAMRLFQDAEDTLGKLALHLAGQGHDIEF